MSSTRTADFTIQGFLYQFNKTLAELLSSSDSSTITVEGIVEDIEVTLKGKTKAIQCKYHEGKGKFNFSSIYKPVLQMMEHFHNNRTLEVNYKLYAYFPTEVTASRPVTQQELLEALDSKSKALQKYIVPLKGHVDLPSFLSRFSLEFGKSLQALSDQVYTTLESCGFDKDDVPILIYPNAIHLISQYSIAHDVTKRRVTKKEFVSALKLLKTTAITKWTLSLKNAEELLAALRAQLKHNLSKNSRKRVFLLGPSLDNFLKEIVPFIQEYLEKYHYKPCHISTPLFCIDCSKTEINKICNRLYQKGIRATTGQVGGRFERDEILREPIIKRKGIGVERDTHLRLVSCKRIDAVFPDYPCDDLIIVGTAARPKRLPKDVVLELINVSSFQNLKYALGVTNARQ